MIDPSMHQAAMAIEVDVDALLQAAAKLDGGAGVTERVVGSAAASPQPQPVSSPSWGGWLAAAPTGKTRPQSWASFQCGR